MPSLKLKILCQDQGGGCEGDIGLFPEAVDTLNRKFADGEIQTLSLTGKRDFRELDDLIQYQVKTTRLYGKGKIAIADSLSFSTSYFVGQAVVTVQNQPVHIDIEPDLPPAVWNHLLQYACGLYLPTQLQGSGSVSRNSPWLLMLMWRCAFEQAIRRGSIPRSYVQENRNLRFFRGRLDVARQLQYNLTDQSRFYCQYNPLSMDITINRVIRYVYKLVVNAASIDKTVFRALAEHDDLLASFGVDNSPVSPEQIDRISYHRMNIMYRPLMQLSKAMIRRFGAKNAHSAQESMSYFVDWTEIWENYLLQVMRRHIPGFTFVSPNDLAANEELLDCGRGIRPDFLVYNSRNELVAVMDAKYKNYNSIGAVPGGISREDLYQMTTYLYHYSKPERQLHGIFLARGAADAQSKFKNGNGQICLCNLKLPDNVDDFESKERNFAEKLQAALSAD